MTGPLRVRVAEVVAETSEARSFVLDVPDEHADAFRYSPGQFLTVQVPSEPNGSVARCYSLSSSPYTGAPPTITVKRIANGYASGWLCDNIEPGTELTILPPAGVFTPSSLDADLLLFAGGSGITPAMSVIRSVLAHGRGTVVLCYANRDERSVIFADQLRELAAGSGGRLVVVHWLESLLGLPSREALRALAAPYRRRETLLCGPAEFMDTVRGALDDLDVPRANVHVEKFLSLTDNPFAPRDPDSTDTGETDDRADATVTVELDGERHSLAWPPGTKLLDLLLDSGIAAPYSCREGACSACACRLNSGQVKMLNNEVLDQVDLDEGIVLACQSLPVTDSVDISYE